MCAVRVQATCSEGARCVKLECKVRAEGVQGVCRWGARRVQRGCKVCRRLDLSSTTSGVPNDLGCGVAW